MSILRERDFSRNLGEEEGTVVVRGWSGVGCEGKGTVEESSAEDGGCFGGHFDSIEIGESS